MLDKTIKNDDAIFKALDLKTINRLICTTDKGTLSLQIRKGETNYHLCLDSVPLDKELNKTLMELLFPISKLEIPQVKKNFEGNLEAEEDNIPSGLIRISGTNITKKQIPSLANIKIIKSQKKLGRPKGSKDGIKNME